MRFIYLFFSFFISLITVQAQNHLSGFIKSQDENVEKVFITLKNKEHTYETTSNKDGSFMIENPAFGEYELSAKEKSHSLFLENVKIDSVTINEKLILEFIHHEHQIKSVEIIGRSAKKYHSDYSFSATKIAIDNKELPLAISTVSKELIADTQAYQVGDAVKFVSSVTPVSYYNQFTIRGIGQNEEGAIINGMRTRQYYFTQPITSNLEKIEVIKGPASATLSSVDPGGSIVLVTKKPLKQERKEISMTVGSFSTIRTSLDFTGPLDKKKTLLYRFNAAYSDNKSFRDLQYQKAVLLSPSISYLPDDKTALNVELIYSNSDSRIDRGQPIFGAVTGATSLYSTPISFNLGASNDYFKSKELIIMGNFTRQLFKNISFNLAYMKQTWSEDLQEYRTTNAFAVDADNNKIPSLAAMQMIQRNQFWNTDNLNAYFALDFKTGPLEHKFMAGYDYISTHKYKGGSQNTARGYLLKNGTTTNVYNPNNASEYEMVTIDGITMPKPNVEHFNLIQPSYTSKNPSDYKFTSLALPSALVSSNGLYIQDQIQWGKLHLFLSLRQEWFSDHNNYKESNSYTIKDAQLIPRIGITYNLTENINLYTSYIEGFQPQSNTASLAPITIPAGRAFKPLISNSKEIGMKADFLKKALHVDLAFYEIKQKNILLNANDPTNVDLLVNRGEERSRGFEIEVVGYLLPNWQMNFAYGYNNAIIVKDTNPDLVGARKQNTPYNSLSIWQKYKFKKHSFLREFAVGVGMQYSGNKVPLYNRTFIVPDYTVFDSAIYYSPKGGHLEMAMHVNNILNKIYWLGAQNYLRLFPGAPRNISLTATYKF